MNAKNKYRNVGLPINFDNTKIIEPMGTEFIYLTITISWITSLLPYRVFLEFPIVVISFWCIYESSKIGLLTAFFFSILIDVQQSLLMGSSALEYLLIAYFSLFLHRRLLCFGLLSQSLHLLPVFFFSKLIRSLLISWINGYWIGWLLILDTMIIAMIWPILSWVLLRYKHIYEDSDMS
ncbi:rod shape-determining protein MreD [Candidatus Kinetoplastibacterium blastocrithidii TCC012E]|uniref:Rod shape-determining protein MreD n=1 Tax=Candidatus Kinetoplastidibacterium blastocrithidiae TCC012E TaxID=1208922 RepID=M1M1D6_9PROT|nr:rod shape-determining protein MreD [Candidatus Kinetoplastibacterium blastocrithidii]AFZ83270.1 rod shape-determining protein MreD [Candidatus Kinetoplastibacterium blastocrithidii (ex Strigomonas culicis)]AGF50086.1 rod shape-determining protein MreD [Candidatus Kinetoplastibacterium blastocrithidii TCC012E]